MRAHVAPVAIRMAERGHAAAALSYRLAPEAPCPAAIVGAKAAVRRVRAHAGEYGIGPGRIAIAGGSAGGQIAALTGTPHACWLFDPWRAPTVGAADAFLRDVMPARTAPPGSAPAA